MKRNTAYGSFEIPDTWSDETVVQFYSPALESPVMDVAAAGSAIPPTQTRGVVSVTRARLPKGGLVEYLAAKELEFKKMFSEFQVVSRGAWPHPSLEQLPAWEITYPLMPGVPVQQLQGFAVDKDGRSATVLTFMTHVSKFKEHRQGFEAIFTSFRLP
jgi:hypothetical protein